MEVMLLNLIGRFKFIFNYLNVDFSEVKKIVELKILLDLKRYNVYSDKLKSGKRLNYFIIFFSVYYLLLY